MTVKEHYDNHLGQFYSWMTGNFDEKQKEFQQFLEDHDIYPKLTKLAVDLGAGHGIQSVSLAKLGFKVKAIDFNHQLLNELKHNGKGLDIDFIEDDIVSINKHACPQPELIICWGDTIAHLDSVGTIERLLIDCHEALMKTGKLILSFRDYSNELTGDARFIPVKSDQNRILTCFLEYRPEHVKVTDLLYEKDGASWKQKISSYNKVRVSTSAVKTTLHQIGMEIIFEGIVSRLTTIIVIKN
jgi:hypothetical protein